MDSSETLRYIGSARRKSFISGRPSRAGVIFLCVTLISSALPSAASSADAGVPSASGLPSSEGSFLRIEDLGIPPELGTIEETFEGKSEKTLIYIQDSHDSLEAQENIAGLIRYLVEKHGVKTVFEEGYGGPVPTDDYFRSAGSRETREKVSFFLLDRLRLGGAEYAHINRGKDFSLIGAEDFSLYHENVEEYRRLSDHGPGTERDVRKIEALLGSLAGRYFSPPLKEWIRLRERFHGSRIDAVEYIRRTAALLPEGRLADYPGAAALLGMQPPGGPSRTSDTEGTPAGPPEEIPVSLAAAALRDLTRLETDVSGFLAVDETASEVFRYYEIFRLLEKLRTARLNSDEFNGLERALASLKTGDLARFISAHAKKSVVLRSDWENDTRAALHYYELARQRERVLEQTLRHFTGERAVLVFGGFHAAGIREILRGLGFSYIIVSPKITHLSPRHMNYYRQIMDDGRLGFEAALPARAVKQPGIYALPFYGPDVIARIARRVERLAALDRDSLHAALDAPGLFAAEPPHQAAAAPAQEKYNWIYEMDFSPRSEKHPFTFDDFPDSEFQRLKDLGMSVVWIAGIYEESPYSKELNEYWAEKENKGPRVASSYSIYDYRIRKSLGGEEGLKRFSDRANRFGLAVIVDVVPNHMAADTPLLQTHPGMFMTPSQAEIDFDRDYLDRVPWNAMTPIFRDPVSGKIFNHGAVLQIKPYPEENRQRIIYKDVVQIDITKAEARRYLEDVMFRLAELTNGGGFRVDAIMHTVRHEFKNKWFPDLSEAEYEKIYPSSDDFVSTVFPKLRRRWPHIVLLGEHWGPDPQHVIDRGFNFTLETYTRHRLRDHDMPGLKEVLRDLDEAQKFDYAKYLESHDREGRILHLAGREPSFPAAVLYALLPGATLVQAGQELGYSKWVPEPVKIEGPPETVDPAFEELYKRLGALSYNDVFRSGGFHMVPVREIGSAANVVAFRRFFGNETRVVAVNYGSEAARFVLSGVSKEEIALPPWGAEVFDLREGKLTALLGMKSIRDWEAQRDRAGSAAGSGLPEAFPWIYNIDWRLLGHPDFAPRSETRQMKLSEFPDAEFDRLRRMGMSIIWLDGIYEASPYSLKLNRYWGAKEGDPHPRTASSYAPYRLRVREDMGGDEGLRDFSARATRYGLKVMLGAIPNHLAADSPVIAERPGMFLKPPEETVERERPWSALTPENELAPIFRDEASGGYFYHGGGWSARRGNFTYKDTVQVDLTSPEARAYMENVLLEQARLTRGGGFRFDSVVHLIRENFRRRWFPDVSKEAFERLYPEAEEFLAGVIRKLRSEWPDIPLIAEYWLEDTDYVLGLGFDFVHENEARDELINGDAGKIREYLRRLEKKGDYRFIRHLESHDRGRRIRDLLGPERTMAATVLMGTLPGAMFVLNGQEKGYSRWNPSAIHIDGPAETVDEKTEDLFMRLGRETKNDIFRSGGFHVLEPGGGARAKDLLLYEREYNGQKRIVAVNYGQEEAVFSIPGFETSGPVHLAPWQSEIFAASGNSLEPLLRRTLFQAAPDRGPAREKFPWVYQLDFRLMHAYETGPDGGKTLPKAVPLDGPGAYAASKRAFTRQLVARTTRAVDEIYAGGIKPSESLGLLSNRLYGVFENAVRETVGWLKTADLPREIVQDEAEFRRLVNGMAIIGYGGIGRRMFYGASSDIDWIFIFPETTVSGSVLESIKEEIFDIVKRAVPNNMKRDIHAVSRISELEANFRNNVYTPMDAVILAHTGYVAGDEALFQRFRRTVNDALERGMPYDSIQLMNYFIRRTDQEHTSLEDSLNLKLMPGGFTEIAFLYHLAHAENGFGSMSFTDALDYLETREIITAEDRERVLDMLGILTFARLRNGGIYLTRRAFEQILSEIPLAPEEFERRKAAFREVVFKVEREFLRKSLELTPYQIMVLMAVRWTWPFAFRMNFGINGENPYLDNYILWITTYSDALEGAVRRENYLTGGRLENGDWLTLLALAGNPKTPPDILHWMLRYERLPRFREQIALIAKNPGAHTYTLLHIARSPHIKPIYQGWALENLHQRIRRKFGAVGIGVPDLVRSSSGLTDAGPSLERLLPWIRALPDAVPPWITDGAAREPARGGSAGSYVAQALEETRDYSGTVFVPYGDLGGPRSEIRQAAFALAEALHGTPKKMVIYAADLTDPGLKDFRDSGALMTASALPEAYAAFGEKRDGANVSLSVNADYLRGQAEKIGKRELRHLLVRSPADIWASWLLTVYASLPGITQSHGILLIENGFLEDALARYQSTIVVQMAA